MGMASAVASRVIGVVVTLLLMSPLSDAAASDTLEYAACSEQKCTPGSQYSSNLNSLLASLLAAASSSYSSNQTAGSAHGLFQCRPDVLDCSACVSACVAQLGVVCPSSLSAALRLEGCYVRYDNVSFFGVEDTTLVLKKCGAQQLDSSSDVPGRRDSVLGYLATGAQMFRTGADGDVTGVAECVGGLSPAQCQDCLAQAIGLLKSACWYAASGDVYLASCYARYTVKAVSHASTPKTDAESSTNGVGTQKTLAIIIGIIAIIGLIVIVAVFLRKHSKDDGCSHDHHHK